GKKVVAFADTIKMSTYLVAYIVGELEATEPVMIGATPLRVWCVPGKKRLAGFGQAIGAASLQFFEEYYGIPYPGDKLDLLAIPDFAAGAMENLGAITFRETALLVDKADTGDLWSALGRASREPIPAVMDAWIFSPGYPLVSLRREGDELVLAQQRFTYISSTSDQRWKVPVQLRIDAGGRSETRRIL